MTAHPTPATTPLDEPLPCPFCGEVCVTQDTHSGFKWGAIICTKCCAAGPEVRTEYKAPKVWYADAVTEWNTRTALPVPPVAMDGEASNGVVTQRPTARQAVSSADGAVIPEVGGSLSVANPHPAPVARSGEVVAWTLENARRDCEFAYRDADGDKADSRVIAARTRFSALLALYRPAGETRAECVWTHNDDGFWATSCGESWVLSNDEGPSANGMKFCHACGKPLTALPPSHAGDTQ